MAATEQPLQVNRRHMPFELDGGVAPRAAIGLIVLATDNTIEHEFRQIVPRVEGAAVFHTRILPAAWSRMSWPDISSRPPPSRKAASSDSYGPIGPG